ncbi:MAG: universal stress protein [Archaeoglobus sp.]|uniref:universal stress protein n=1 Tax=Archaeoglobus sp. TaxID=1872626 RepID=UPI001D61DA68|nr:universal stress protein [Archaeoglobus sp.]MBO8180005.1 universal stress protein [Archaeoglobus sp.]
MLRKMLFPTDLSENSFKVLEYLDDFRKVGVEEIGVFFVVNITKLSTVSGGIDIDYYIDEMTEKAEEVLPKVTQKIEDSGIRSEIIRPFPVGDPVVEITKAAENYDFIAMGSRGASSFKKILLGSVSEGVLHDSSVPVYVFKEDMVVNSLFDRVLVAYDFSKWADRVLEYAKFVVKKAGGELHIIHVAEEGSKTDDLRLMEESIKAEGIEAHIHVESGTPHKAILAKRDEIDATTIFIGSRGVGGVKAMILGSTSESVIRRSTVPVFVCKRGDNE